ncbi:MAG: restriction modification system DNA specificity subunit [Marinobacter sp. T13-3]|jgi:type I restriction enzyme S subunit|nr:MAG: restriction modification system DNA specificity subunit [Marinobacter sp. T13-3]
MSNAVPEGWQVRSIGDLVTLQYGKSPKEVMAEDGQYPVIGTGGVTGYASSYLYDGCTTVIGRKGTINKPSYVEGKFWAIDTTYFGTGYKEAEPKWFYYSLNSFDLSKYNEASGVPSLGRDTLNAIPLLTPPLLEQQKIAAILSSVDDLIGKTRAQIEKLKDLKTGMMQELLTKGIGSGGVPHTEFKDSPVGRIPACWEVRKADDISDAVMVGVVIKPTQYYVDQGVPALRSANVRENGLTMDNLKYFSEESNDLLHKSKLRKGDLLTVRTGYPGTTAVVTSEFEGCNCIDVVITRPSAEMDSDFFCLWVNSDHGKGQVLKAQGGLAQQHFNVADMKNLLVPVPPIQEQRSIFRAVSSVVSKISFSEQKLARLTNIKKALMQDLLTGKVRVSQMNG